MVQNKIKQLCRYCYDSYGTPLSYEFDSSGSNSKTSQGLPRMYFLGLKTLRL